jgi:hypothetical protein
MSDQGYKLSRLLTKIRPNMERLPNLDSSPISVPTLDGTSEELTCEKIRVPQEIPRLGSARRLSPSK